MKTIGVFTKNILLLILMFASAGGAVTLRPTYKIADQGPAIQLQAMIPKQFGDWVEEEQVNALIVDPRQLEVIEKIYSQTLSRTYKNAEGYRIMLSLAYGSDQRDAMQVHKPEVCYPAQGFVLQGKKDGVLATPGGRIPVVRINTSLGQRIEPVTYWTTVGNQVVTDGIRKKLVEMSYGLTGKIPDGMLIRVSSIDADIERAYVLQEQFSVQMLASTSSQYRQRLSGI